jgi:hypothetical protein
VTSDPDNITDTGNDTAEPATAPEQADRRDRSALGTIALIAVAAVIVLLVLTQCTARVPSVTGLDRSAAEARLKRSGLKVGDVSEVTVPSPKEGLVAEQTPAAGVMLRTGGAVDITLARSTRLTTVPDVQGRDAANASVALQAAGFAPDPADEYSDTVPLGAAIRQSPAGGTQAANGSSVTVYYSLGPQTSAESSVTPSNTSGGYGQNVGTSGAGVVDTPIFSTARAYPGAVAWSSGGDIYVRLSAGAASRRVTSGSPWDTHAIVAPSGRYLIFMRAATRSDLPTAIGAVSFTDFSMHLLTTPKVDATPYPDRWVGTPIFAPSAHSTTPDSDWIVYPHYFPESGRDISADDVVVQPSAQLLVCKVPYDTTWISWNGQFRPAHTIQLSASSRTGSVRVRQFSGGHKTYDRNLYLPTGIYAR